MAPTWRRPRTAEPLPKDVARALDLLTGERLLAWAADAISGEVVVAGSKRLYAVSADGEAVLTRPWHLVDGGAWDHDAFELTVTWVDREPPSTWRLPDRTLLPETLRERVQASVVLAETVRLGGGRSARVVIRRDLGSGDLVGQTLLGPGVRAADPGVLETTEAALDGLKEQVGLT